MEITPEQNTNKIWTGTLKQYILPFFAQFALDPRFVRFKFKVVSFVRAQIVDYLLANIGVKKSETNLTKQSFGVIEPVMYVTKDLSVRTANMYTN